MPRLCVFCEGQAGNQEHALPRWLAKLFTDDVVDFSQRIHDGSEPRGRLWRGRPFSATVGTVCRACNNGWMSDLENASAPILKPLVRGEETTLTSAEQHQVATWAVKTMLMLRLVSWDGDSQELAPDTYSWLRRFGTPPPAEQVWLASYAGEGQWPMTFHYYAAGVAPLGETRPTALNAHCSAFAIGHLALGLAGSRLREAPPAVPSLPPDTWRPMWPAYGETIAFPPPSILAGDDEMRSLAEPSRWGG